MANKSPAFQWYPKDILTSLRVAELTLAEEGAYRRLLDLCWLNGSIPNDAKRVARIIGKGATEEMAKICMEFFITAPDNEDVLIHDRLESERDKQSENSQKRRKAADARWGKRGTPAKGSGEQVKPHKTSNASAMQMDMQMQCSSSSSSTAIQKELPNGSSKKPPQREPSADDFGKPIGGLSSRPPPGYVPKPDKAEMQSWFEAIARRLGYDPSAIPERGKFEKAIPLAVKNNLSVAEYLAAIDHAETDGGLRFNPPEKLVAIAMELKRGVKTNGKSSGSYQQERADRAIRNRSLREQFKADVARTDAERAAGLLEADISDRGQELSIVGTDADR